MPVLLVEKMPGCSGSAQLSCVANGATSLFFQVFKSNGDRFETLTSSRIHEDPDYNEIQVNGMYILQVIRAEKHSGSQFRCIAYFNGAVVYSNEVQVPLAGKFESGV